MIWFEYKYKTFSEIIKNIKIFTNYSTYELIILIISIFIILLLIIYIIPIIKVYFNYKKILKEKSKKKEFLRKISLQKDIEDQIAKEINIW